MNSELAKALQDWSAAEEEARICQTQLRNHWVNRKTALARVKKLSAEAGLQKGAVFQQNGDRIQLHEAKTKKPLTLRAVQRGLMKCVRDKEDVRAILAVIQEERGEILKTELRRLGE